MIIELNMGPEIYIIDDDIFYRNFLKSVLVLNKFEHIKTFGTGKLMLDVLKNEPDYIIIDQEMPELTGLEVIKRLKERNIKSDIIMISASKDKDLKQKAIKSGARYFFKKNNMLHKELLNIIKNRDSEQLLYA